MHRRLAALLGMIGFILVAGYWGVNALWDAMDGRVNPNMPAVEWVLVRALVAMVFCFLMGWVLSRHGIALLKEAMEQAEMHDYITPGSMSGARPEAPRAATGGATTERVTGAEDKTPSASEEGQD